MSASPLVDPPIDPSRLPQTVAAGLKIVFVMRSHAHLAYHSTTIEHLLRRRHSIHVLFDPSRTNRDVTEQRSVQVWVAGRNGIDVGYAVPPSGFWHEVLAVTREARTYASYCRRRSGSTIYQERWQKYLPDSLQQFSRTRTGAWVFRRNVTGRLLGAIERRTPADSAIVAALRREAPDCVVASPTTMRSDAGIEYVKAARALAIPSVVPVLSWDNLTTKGLMHVQPDLVLAWHAGHRQEARSIHQVPASRIVVAGSPFFDKWFDRSAPIRSRSATCLQTNLDPSRPYVLYLGSSGTIAGDESWLVLRLAEAIRASSDPWLRKLQLIFKPHPANLRALPKLDAGAVIVWPREPGLPDTSETIRQFRDMLHHAVCVVGINTTGMVDAVLCDRPCVALTVREYDAKQIETVHFRRMVQSKAFYTAHSGKEVLRLLLRLRAGKDTCAGARRKFMRDYARPRGLGGDAGEAAALAIEQAAARRTAADITAAIEREFAGRPAPPPPEVEADPRPSESQVIRRAIEKARKSRIFRHYEQVRDVVLQMMDEQRDYSYSTYWKAESDGFVYMFDASPMVIAKLREHAHHVTGVKAYEYRDHHAARALRFADKLRLLKEQDRSGLFVPEAPQLGGFGYRIQRQLVNLDTLKFYECLVALDRAGVVAPMRAASQRQRVVEIGAGWGGFAYQFKTLFPNTTYIIVDLPPTLLFSVTYLKATFPDARVRMYSEVPEEDLFTGSDEVDFIFLPAHTFSRLALPAVDLAVNIASFQEMTSEQVAGYVQKLADSRCPRLYSLNKDRSKFNDELSSVTDIIRTKYCVERLDVLGVPYNVLEWEPGQDFGPATKHYQHSIGRRESQTSS
jgi:hypothetical protein